jgi:hypothetical protein
MSNMQCRHGANYICDVNGFRCPHAGPHEKAESCKYYCEITYEYKKKGIKRPKCISVELYPKGEKRSIFFL